jgi:CheY-like chemotaxis protein
MKTHAEVLVVDDDAQVLKLFSKILVSGGYSVRTENSGARAIEALDDGKPVDLMVLDLSMPERDGFDILRVLQKERPGLRVLVTSGAMGGVLLKASRFLGATAILNKTDAPKMLLETVNRLLQR